MEDAAKKVSATAPQNAEKQVNQDTHSDEAFVGYVDDSAPEQANNAPALRAADNTRPKWLREWEKPTGLLDLLDLPNEVLVEDCGPLQISGNLTLVNEQGYAIYANRLTLCRCGHSADKPFCDESHLDM
jgi:hypothetical protein